MKREDFVELHRILAVLQFETELVLTNNDLTESYRTELVKILDAVHSLRNAPIVLDNVPYLRV